MTDREKAILGVIDRYASKCPTCHVRDACRQTGYAHYTAAQLTMINSCARVVHDELLAVGAFDLPISLGMVPDPERTCGTCGHYTANKDCKLDFECPGYRYWTPREGKE